MLELLEYRLSPDAETIYLYYDNGIPPIKTAIISGSNLCQILKGCHAIKSYNEKTGEIMLEFKYDYPDENGCHQQSISQKKMPLKKYMQYEFNYDIAEDCLKFILKTPKY